MKSLLFFLVTLLAMAFTRVCLASLSVEACEAVFSAALENSSRSTEVYLSLFRALAKNRNALTLEDFTLITSQGEGVNPFQIIKPALSSEDRFAFEKAFEGLLKNQRANPLDWARIKAELEVMAQEKQVAEMARGRARAKTEAIFAPVLRDEVNDSDGLFGETFKLLDGSMMGVFQDGPHLSLFDITKKTERLKLGSWFGHKNIKDFKLKSGATLFAAGTTERLTIYELASGQEVKKIGEEFLPVYPDSFFRDYFDVDLEKSFLTESQRGRPAVMEVVKRKDSHGRFRDIAGYLEVEIETGVKRYFPAPENEYERFEIASNNHLLSYTIVPAKELVVRDLSSDKIINRIHLDIGYRTILSLKSFTEDGGDELLLSTSSTMRGGASKVDLWIYLDSGKDFDLSREIKNSFSAEILLKSNNDYHIMSEDHLLNSVMVFDQTNHHWEVYKLPGIVNGPKYTRLLKRRSGSTILFAGTNQSATGGFFLYWLPLEKGAVVSKMPFYDQDINRLREVYETEDGRIEALFETHGGYKIFQVFGPLGKAGAI